VDLRPAADVVDQDVHAAVGLHGAGDHLGGGLRSPQVHPDLGHRRPERVEAGRGRARGGDDLRALGGQPLGDRQPDPARRARHDGHLVLQLQLMSGSSRCRSIGTE